MSFKAGDRVILHDPDEGLEDVLAVVLSDEIINGTLAVELLDPAAQSCCYEVPIETVFHAVLPTGLVTE